ncbi:MAG TPA: P1 family peptidase [Thermoplasmata archaeon]|nr:P1 family peptidase [Thermoplasmata archaeon]
MGLGGHSTLTAVPGVKVGHATDPERTSGVTAVCFADSSPCAIDVRGGASCTYDTASLDLDATFGRRWAVFFSGGSVFGLDAGRGVRNRLLEGGAGRGVFEGAVPIVQITGATLYDLPRRAGEWPPDYLPLGYEAARSASDASVESGPIGAGTGATVGKYLGRGRASPGGIGSAATRHSRDGYVGVLVAVNSVGGVRDPDSGRWVAGARNRAGRVVPPPDRLRIRPPSLTGGRGTTLALVATDLPLDRRELKRVAVMAQSGIGRSIAPAHASVDGDVVFAVATGANRAASPEAHPGARADAVGHLAAALASEAIVRAVNPTR